MHTSKITKNCQDVFWDFFGGRAEQFSMQKLRSWERGICFVSINAKPFCNFGYMCNMLCNTQWTQLCNILWNILSDIFAKSYQPATVNSPKRADTNILLKKHKCKTCNTRSWVWEKYPISCKVFLNCKLFGEQKQHVVNVSPAAPKIWEISINKQAPVIIISTQLLHIWLLHNIWKFVLSVSWDCLRSCDSTLRYDCYSRILPMIDVFST